MRSFTLSRYALSISAATALLSGCGGSQPPIGAPRAMSQSRAIAQHAKKHSRSFTYTGSEQTFEVPTGVSEITVTASGASGGQYDGSGVVSGLGGMVSATVSVTPGESLAIFVGGQGDYYGGYGYNGGAPGGEYQGSSAGSAGGGASDIRRGGDGLQNRIVVAGGGGGAGNRRYSNSGPAPNGGDGGGIKGRRGSPDMRTPHNGVGGIGGFQQRGGRGGSGGNSRPGHEGHPGDAGTLGNGGAGGAACLANVGSGGGGGYYGGGGGGGGGCWFFSGTPEPGIGAGGGGGSSYVEKGATHVMEHSGGAAAGNGQIIITWRAH